MQTEKINLIIVDDHCIVIDGLKALLGGSPMFNIVATTSDPTTVVTLLQKNQVDVLLTDVMMPQLNGRALAKQVRATFPHIKILALSMSGQGEVVSEMINDADINGYVLKNIGKEELTIAITKIAAGGIYFSEEVLIELEKAATIKRQNNEVQLTAREIEIIRLIEKELSNKRIADTLFISERTVETHRKNIFRKTQTNSLIGLVKYAYEHKLI